MTLENCTLRLAAGDEVAVATRDLTAGTVLATDAGPALEVRANVPRGHKIALADVPAGAAVHKYGQSIGRGQPASAAGDHVHTHNLGMDQSPAGLRVRRPPA